MIILSKIKVCSFLLSRITTFLILVLCVSTIEAKKVKVSNYITINGKIDQTTGLLSGEGMLTMSQGKNVDPYSKTLIVGVKDVLYGNFNGSHVRRAKILFGSGYTFQGEIDYKYYTNNGSDILEYKLIEGYLTTDKGKIINVPENANILLTRKMDSQKTSVSLQGWKVVENTKIDNYANNPLAAIGDLSTAYLELEIEIVNKGYQIVNGMAPLLSLANSSVTYSEVWQISSTIVGAKFTDGNYWTLKQSNNIYKVANAKGDYITWDNVNNSVVSMHKTFTDGTLVLEDNSQFAINYSDGSKYEGKFSSVICDPRGRYYNFSKMLKFFARINSLTELKCQFTDGRYTKYEEIQLWQNSIWNNMLSNHKDVSIKGTWESETHNDNSTRHVAVFEFGNNQILYVNLMIIVKTLVGDLYIMFNKEGSYQYDGRALLLDFPSSPAKPSVKYNMNDAGREKYNNDLAFRQSTDKMLKNAPDELYGKYDDMINSVFRRQKVQVYYLKEDSLLMIDESGKEITFISSTFNIPNSSIINNRIDNVSIETSIGNNKSNNLTICKRDGYTRLSDLKSSDLNTSRSRFRKVRLDLSAAHNNTDGNYVSVILHNLTTGDTEWYMNRIQTLGKSAGRQIRDNSSEDKDITKIGSLVPGSDNLYEYTFDSEMEVRLIDSKVDKSMVWIKLK